VRDDLVSLHARAHAAGFNEISMKRVGDGFQAWLNRPEWAYSGEGQTPTRALEQALDNALSETASRPL
jgi:hypothetical protein